jgi:NADH-quinone oxidoreductase subunit A
MVRRFGGDESEALEQQVDPPKGVSSCLMELADYLPIALMTILGLLFGGISLFMSKKLAPNNPTPEKLAPYECGIVPLQDQGERFPVRFYLVAMLFVIFDVEIIFLFLWAVRMDHFGWAGVASVVAFMLMLIETLAYVWKRGALDWNVQRRARYRTVVAPDIQIEEAA